MRFYILPAVEGKTVCINFDHVASIAVGAKNIELFFTGLEAPMIIPKTTANLSQIAKGMDLSDSTKEMVSGL